MRKIFAIVFCFISLSVYSQGYSPGRHIPINDAIFPASNAPFNGRLMYYDSTLFKYRDFKDTTEVRLNRTTNASRFGHEFISVHQGGTLNPDGSFTGGIVTLWWYRNGLADNNLVKVYVDSVNITREVDTLYRKTDSTIGFTIGHGPEQIILIRGTAAGGISSLLLTTPVTLFGSPVTFSNSGGAWSGTLSLINQGPNMVFAGPSLGSSAQPAFRSLVVGDLPNGIPNGNLQNSSIVFATGTSGTDINWSSSSVSLGNTATLNIPTASSAARGLLNQATYNYFSAKVDSVHFSNDSIYDCVAGVCTFRGFVAVGGGGINQLTGDGTAGPGGGSQVFTLSTVNSNVGSFGSASNVSSYTVDGKGRLTSSANVPIQIAESQVTNLVTDLAGKLSAGGNLPPLFTTSVVGTTLNFSLSNTTPYAAFGNFTNTTAPPSFSKIPYQAFAVNSPNLLLGWDGSGNPAPISFTTIGTSGAATLSGGVLNIPQYSGGGGSISLTTASVTSQSPTLTSGVLNIDTMRYRRIFNVVDYGADRTGSVDATAAIQSAINDANSYGGGIVWLPIGIYKVSGALQTSVGGVNPNCQIYIPASIVTSASRPQITIEGEGSNLFPSGYFSGVPIPLPTTGVIIKSTITGSGTNPAVFGTIAPAGSYQNFNYSDIYFKNITVETYTNSGASATTMTGINMTNAAKVSFQKVSVCLDVINQNSQNPSANEVAGIIVSKSSNDGPNYLSECYVAGYKYGYILSEHTVVNQIYALSCNYGIVVPFGYFRVEGNALVHACNHEVYFPNAAIMGITSGRGNVNLTIESEVDSVIASTGNFWYNTVDNVTDPGNNGYGQLRFQNVIGGGAFATGRITVNGGLNLDVSSYDNFAPGNLVIQNIDTTWSEIAQNARYNGSSWTRRNNGNMFVDEMYHGNRYIRSLPYGLAGTSSLSYTDLMYIDSSGKIGLGTVAPNAWLSLKAGTTALAPLNLPPSTLTTTPVNGNIENNGTHVYATLGGTRYQLDQQSGAGTNPIGGDGAVQYDSSGFFSGNLVTGPIWNRTNKQFLINGTNTAGLQIQANDIGLQSTGTNNLDFLSSNVYFDGSNLIYINTGTANQLIFDQGNFGFRTISSGTAGTVATSNLKTPLVVGADQSVRLGGNISPVSPYTGALMSVFSTGDVSIGTTTDNSSALLNLVTTTKGFQPPAMTTTQQNAISSPSTGLLVYNTSLLTPSYYNGAAWTHPLPELLNQDEQVNLNTHNLIFTKGGLIKFDSLNFDNSPYSILVKSTDSGTRQITPANLATLLGVGGTANIATILNSGNQNANANWTFGGFTTKLNGLRGDTGTVAHVLIQRADSSWGQVTLSGLANLLPADTTTYTNGLSASGSGSNVTVSLGGSAVPNNKSFPAPTDSNIVFDASNTAYKMPIGVAGKPGIIFSQTANGPTIANTTTSSTLLGTGVGSLTIPANALVAGEVLHFHMIVSLGTLAVSPGTLSYTIVFSGGSVGYTSNPPANYSGDAELDVYLTIMSTGSSGSAAGTWSIHYSSGSEFLAGSVSPSTINTTISQTLDLQAQWQTASSSNTIKGLLPSYLKIE